MQHLEQRLFQLRIAVRWAKIQHVRAFAPQDGAHASLEFLDGEELLRRACHHKRERIFRHIGSQAAEDFFSALIGEEQFPPDSPISIQNRRRGRRDLQAVAISLDERAASHVALNQAFRFQLGISVRHRGAVNAEHGGEFAARRNAVAGPQIACMHEGAQLVAKLDVQRNVTLWLEMEWKHCLSPSANSTRYWTGARANLSFRNLAGSRASFLQKAYKNALCAIGGRFRLDWDRNGLGWVDRGKAGAALPHSQRGVARLTAHGLS